MGIFRFEGCGNSAFIAWQAMLLDDGHVTSSALIHTLQRMTDALKTTSLYARHVAEGGRMVPFAGWNMPVQYASVIAEAKAVRESAGMFDVSHMARLKFFGEDVLSFLEHVTTNDVSKLADETGQYSLLPNEHGGCVDDIIVYRRTPTSYWMVVNASNHEKDVAWLRGQSRTDVILEDITSETCMIAVQGPKAVEILALLSDKPEALKAAPAFGLVETKIGGIEVTAARSGYTGEDGYELIASSGDSDALWQVFREAGVAACGLASRDTLRVEAGLPLYGHELGDDINPISAGLGWVISKTKTFIGSEPINKARAEGTPRKLQGIKLGSKRLLSPGMTVSVDGNPVGEITSGVYSPLEDAGVGFAFIDADVKFGTPCTVDIRGKEEPATVANKRFYRRLTS